MQACQRQRQHAAAGMASRLTFAAPGKAWTPVSGKRMRRRPPTPFPTSADDSPATSSAKPRRRRSISAAASSRSRSRSPSPTASTVRDETKQIEKAVTGQQRRAPTAKDFDKLLKPVPA